jgi:hypothetical protein
MLAAMRLASSLLRSFAAACLPGSLSRDVSEWLSVSIAHDVMVGLYFCRPGWWEAARVCHTRLLELAAPLPFPDNFIDKRRALIWHVLLSWLG